MGTGAGRHFPTREAGCAGWCPSFFFVSESLSSTAAADSSKQCLTASSRCPGLSRPHMPLPIFSAVIEGFEANHARSPLAHLLQPLLPLYPSRKPYSHISSSETVPCDQDSWCRVDERTDRERF